MPDPEVIEGEAFALDLERSEIPDSLRRAVVVSQPGQAIISRAEDGPEQMIVVASRLAVALKDIVEKQRLFTVINGRKFPQVEAWMTIGRLDNVVAREAERPIRNDDGSYEGFVELVRLSDGAIIGRASALCGTPDDKPWATRAEPARRSMAVTRATSRAFRQQYSWIMALAGYEPTPAEEMPSDDKPVQVGPEERLVGEITRTGKVAKGSALTADLEWRDGPDGHSIGFALHIADDKNIPQVIAKDGFGEALYLATAKADLKGQRVKVTGRLFEVREPGKTTFYRLYLTGIETDEFTLPAAVPSEEAFDAAQREATYEAAAIVGVGPLAEAVPAFTAEELADVK